MVETLPPGDQPPPLPDLARRRALRGVAVTGLGQVALPSWFVLGSVAASDFESPLLLAAAAATWFGFRYGRLEFQRDLDGLP